MVVVRLKGGLGNQMFQYAAGMAAARQRGGKLFLDLSAYDAQFKKDTPRKFELADFRISRNMRRDIRLSGVSRCWTRVRNKVFPPDPYGYRPHTLRRAALDGYFQNERYFVDVRSDVLAEFSLANISEKFQQICSEIAGCNSVAMHVRRGDYVSNPHANAFHGVLDIDYFRAGYGELAKRCKDSLALFVFTDDAAWVKQNVDFAGNVRLVSGSGLRASEEIILMSKCRNIVISNSSFSWWGAWLNQNPNKIVVAPERWAKGVSGARILPSEWIKI